MHHNRQQAIRVLIETLHELGYDAKTGESMPDRLSYSETEAAKMLSISARKLFGLRTEGKISAKKIGTRTVYLREELLRFLREEGGE